MAGRLLSSVRAAARLLCTFTPAERDLGVSDLSRRLGLSKSAVHRLLTTLATEHLIEQDPRTNRYRLGIKVYELGTIVSTHFDLHEAVAIHIDELRLRQGQSAQVGILDGLEVVYIDRREHTRMLPAHRDYAHCTACGKVLLAGLPEAELDRVLEGGPLPAKTPDTITDPARLRLDLAAVRERGYAENVGESAPDVAAVAAPIRDHSGDVVAAISVAGPLARMGDAARRRVATAIIDTTGRISERLGYSRTQPPRRRSA